MIQQMCLVARQHVPCDDARCVFCHQPFKFGVNVFTREGAAEVGISGICEKCFDEVTAEPDDD